MSYEDKLDVISKHKDYSDWPNTFNRFSAGRVFINALAQFYAYPVLSLTDAMFPAAIRYFLNTTVDGYPYKYFDGDGGHINREGGKFLAERIIIPFLGKYLRGDPAEKTHEGCRLYFDERVSMFPRSHYTNAVSIRWSSWGTTNGFYENSLDYIAAKSPHWAFLNPTAHSGVDRQCLGSTVPQSEARLAFNATCGRTRHCALSVDYLGSWNTSFVGDMNCTVHRVHGRGGKRTRTALGGPVTLPRCTPWTWVPGCRGPTSRWTASTSRPVSPVSPGLFSPPPRLKLQQLLDSTDFSCSSSAC